MIKELDFSEYLKGEKKYKLFFCCGLDDMAEKHVFFVPAKHMELVKPTVKVETCGDSLKVVTDYPSFYTQIDIPDTRYISPERLVEKALGLCERGNIGIAFAVYVPPLTMIVAGAVVLFVPIAAK